MDEWMLIPIFLPIAAGAVLLLGSFLENLRRQTQTSVKNHRGLHVIVMTVLSVSAFAALYVAWTGERSLTLFMLLEDLPVFFRIDAIGRLFVTVVSVI